MEAEDSDSVVSEDALPVWSREKLLLCTRLDETDLVARVVCETDSKESWFS